MKRKCSYLYNEVLGFIEIVERNNKISEINFIKEVLQDTSFYEETELTKLCKKQLQEYFLGKRKIFNIELDIIGTEFQRKVFAELQKIEYGETISYTEEAARLGDKKKARAVGNANGKNKLPIIIPCHRVIKNNGEMGGYTGGVHIKEYLLELEKKNK